MNYLPSQECLDEIQLARFIDGVMDQAERAHAVEHMASCAHCRGNYSALVALLADDTVKAEVTQLRTRISPLRRRRAFAGAGVLIAASIALVLIRGHDRTPVDVERDPTITAVDAPTLKSPIGDVVAVPALTWGLVSGASRYRVTLFDTVGHVVFESETADTTVALPDSVHLQPASSYLWKVEARTRWERWTASTLTEFRIRDRNGRISRAKAPLPPAALAVDVRRRPLDIRDSIATTFAAAAHARNESERQRQFTTARKLAAAYAAAWNDNFLTRRVAFAASLSPAQLSQMVWADSMRRAGNTVYSTDGAHAALSIWHKANSRSLKIGDSAGIAATWGNLGAAFSRIGRFDSAHIYLTKAIKLSARAGDMRVQANALSALAGVIENTSPATATREHYERAIALRQRIGDSRGLASDYNNLAGLAENNGDLAEARRQLTAALAINRKEGRADVAATNLVNLAAISAMAGDFAPATAMYAEAIRTWRAHGQWPDLADALRGLANLDTRRGDYPNAQTHLLQALQLYNRVGQSDDALAVRQELAAARAAQGDLQHAFDDLRRAQSIADSTDAGPDVRADILLARADLARDFNADRQADRFYSDAFALYQRSGNRIGQAEAQQGRAQLMLDHDDAAAAYDVLQSVFRTQRASGNQRAAAITRIMLGSAALQRGDTIQSRSQLKQAVVDLERLGDPVAAAAALGHSAALDAAAGMPASAEATFRRALTMIGARVAPAITWQLHAGLGEVRRTRGALAESALELNRAIADIERSGGALSLAERRSAFLADKWDVYAQAAELAYTRRDANTAFAVSERLRAGEMREMLAQGRVEQPQRTGNLVEREQDLRRRLAELNEELQEAAKDPNGTRGRDVAHASAVTRESLLRTEEAYSDLLLEMRDNAPRHASLVAPAASSWRDVARRLGGEGVLIEYLVTERAAFAFVITRDTLVAVRLGIDRKELGRLIEFTRGTLGPVAANRHNTLWRAPLIELREALIEPIEKAGYLRGKSNLVIVPHGDLHYLPFSALLQEGTQPRFLIQQYRIAVTPSAAVWLALSVRPRSRTTSNTVAFAPSSRTLPATRREVAGIARSGGSGTRIVRGASATESAFRRYAPTSRIVHLAAYGVLNKQNPLFSFVQLARANGDDGRLNAHEVFGMNLSADLVVLSACQTALGSGAISDVPAGDDWVGLTRAFLSAGARNVMASLWPVEDNATATLMQRFYQKYRPGSDPALALAEAQRFLISKPATANPYYWAGFEVIGANVARESSAI